MSTAGEQLARLLALVPWLRARPGVAPQVVAEEFGITLEQLEADLNLLIVCGVPGGQHGELFDIEFWSEDDDETADRIRLGPAITVHDAQNLDRPMRLGPDEAISLLLGLRLLGELPGIVDRERIAALSARLEAVAGDALAEVEGSVRIGGIDTVDPAVLQAVEQSLAQRRQLDIEYLVPSRDEITTRTVDPERVVLIDGHRYLLAWCTTAQDRRHFRVDRIVRATVSDSVAVEHPQDSRTDTRPAYKADPDDVRATLLLQPEARWIVEYAVVESVIENPDGSSTVTLSTGSIAWLARLVLRAAGSAKVLEPPALTKAVLDLAAEAAQAQDQFQRS
jgi:proteasome accessory factor C